MTGWGKVHTIWHNRHIHYGVVYPTAQCGRVHAHVSDVVAAVTLLWWLWQSCYAGCGRCTSWCNMPALLPVQLIGCA